MLPTILETNLGGLPLHARGKVRDIYAVDDSRLLFVATDRISAFDHVLGSGIPRKGIVLTRLSLFWFDFFRDAVPNHVVTARVDEYPQELQSHAAHLEGRSMLVRRADMVPVECVARGYLAGSGWKEYRATQSVCGVRLPAGLREASRLPEPIFTPATKSPTGHDENVSYDEIVNRVGEDIARRLRDLTLDLYTRAAEYARGRGILIADTKFEFGWIDGRLALADEVLTPDSSRFWPAAEYREGGSPPSYDKQYVRDYLETCGWNKQPPAPVLPPEVVERTSAKYEEAYRVLTGRAV